MADQTFPTAGAAQQLTYKHYAAWSAWHVSGPMIYFTDYDGKDIIFTALIGDASRKKKKKKTGAWGIINKCIYQGMRFWYSRSRDAYLNDLIVPYVGNGFRKCIS